jgi:hypothetical protein
MSNEKGVPEFLSADNIADVRSLDSLAKFRSISLRTETEDNHAIQNVSYSKGGDSSGYATMNTAYPKSLDTIFQLSPPDSSSCPERPYCLMRTHFELDSMKMNPSKDGKSKFDKIMEAIDTCLNEFSEYDFTFDDCMWKGKYLQGSSHCEIHVHIYTQSPPSLTYIIEANRVEGDSKPFFNFYREFKALILNTPDVKPVNNFYFEPLSSSKISPDQFLGGVKPIFIMSAEPFFESRLEAAKMLCDLALHPDRSLLQLPDCREQCLVALEKLVTDDFEYVRQHAMCALSAFVDIPGYPELMVRSNVVSVMLAQIENPREPSYETIQCRRECSRVLASLVKYDVSAVMATLLRCGAAVEECLQKVEDIRDKRLKYQAAKMRDAMLQQQSHQTSSSTSRKAK